MIPLSVPVVRGNEWNYVKECLDTEWVSTAGKYVDAFEQQFRKYVGSRYAVSCMNGTAALHVALRVVGVLPGDEVIVPTLTFIATVNAVNYVGANPVFMDCDDYYNIDINKTADFLDKQTVRRDGSTFNRETGRRITAIIPVHIFGNAVKMNELVDICGDRNIRIVEDSAESLGTSYLSQRIESRHTGTIGEIGCFSFNGNKIITTGGGGMIVTEHPQYAERAKYLTTQAKDDEVRYIHNDVGYNFRLTNVQAAIGLAQMEMLPDFLMIKRKNYLRYKEAIDSIDGLEMSEGPPYAKNNHWMYPIRVYKDIYGIDREKLMAHLMREGIQTRPVWHLNHLQVPYRKCQSYHIENAHRMLDMTLNMPCSSNLTESEIDYVISRLHRG